MSDLKRAEELFITLDHPRRVLLVAHSLGVEVEALERALGAHQVMLVKSSKRTAARLLGMTR